ncbi:hypothetical protein [Micromonospora echinospora]
MTTPHTCAGYIEVIGIDVDKRAGCVWKHMQCSVCAQIFDQSEPIGSDTRHPTPTGSGREVSA